MWETAAHLISPMLYLCHLYLLLLLSSTFAFYIRSLFQTLKVCPILFFVSFFNFQLDRKPSSDETLKT